MIGTFLLVGFLLGVRHALDPDHIAAVASLATRSVRTRENVKLAALWGLGHAGVLLGVGALAIGLGITLSDPLPRLFEGIVGLMLIALGADVLRHRRNRVHAHAHRHADGTLHVHFHAHSPAERAHHGEEHPRHEHRHVSASRALLVGGVHGLAGSAALLLLALPGASSAGEALGCLVAFGVGSVLGMMLFSFAISLPLRFSSRHFAPLSRWAEGVLGTATVALGGFILLAALFGA